MDTVNEHWHLYNPPKETNMTVFPQKILESFLRRSSLIEEFGKGKKYLN